MDSFDKIEKFDKKVCDKLENYVYRLVDPRNGNTFYVGKGKGNRIFDHVKCAIKNFESDIDGNIIEDEISAKYNQIREIKNSGLEVIHIIHRYGMSEQEAFEVESALIDCYPGLTNEISGHSHDRGVNTVDSIIRTFSAPIYDEPNFPYIIIKIKKQVLEDRNNNIYETCRSAWKIAEARRDTNKYKYALAVLDGIVIGVYEINNWQVNSHGTADRYEFVGKDAPKGIKDIFIGKKIPDNYRKKGMASPVLFKD